MHDCGAARVVMGKVSKGLCEEADGREPGLRGWPRGGRVLSTKRNLSTRCALTHGAVSAPGSRAWMVPFVPAAVGCTGPLGYTGPWGAQGPGVHRPTGVHRPRGVHRPLGCTGPWGAQARHTQFRWATMMFPQTGLSSGSTTGWGPHRGGVTTPTEVQVAP